MARQLWKFEETHRWVRAVSHNVTVAESKNPMILIESQGEQDYYFAKADVREDLLVPSTHQESSGYRGLKRFWHLKANGHTIENAAWSYMPKENRPNLSNYIAFDWKKMDHWYEETEEVFYHARNPYHRVDFINSERHVVVQVDGVKVAETNTPLLVFETTLTPRIYIPQSDVDRTYLTPNALQTHCPYKGDASYYSIEIHGKTYENAVWYYPNPIPEAPRLKGTMAFWPEKDQQIQLIVDGEPFPK
ncbi:MAG: DUF427 domain-containing protein [Chloroflexota bacterium]